MPLRAGVETEPQWPPRSPHEVLLSTPRGRERLRRLAERTSPSPSPSKRASRLTNARPEPYNPNATHRGDNVMDLDLDDADEETLELQLAAIQAKLKLKKFQAAKAKKAQESDPHTILPESRRIPDDPLPSRTQPHPDGLKSSLATRPQAQVGVQVPASPIKRTQALPDATSPSRVRLGIDKGLRAKDVSLKRAPTVNKTLDTKNAPQEANPRRTNTPVVFGTAQSTTQERPKSFSERLAAARRDEEAQRQRQEKIRQVRTKSFHLGQQEMEELKRNATDIPEVPIQEEQYSREEVMAGAGLKRAATMTGSLQQAQGENEFMIGSETTGPLAQTSSNTSKQKLSPSQIPEAEASAFEPYSSTHLKKRIIPHLTLTRNLSGKKTYTIPDLLKHVKAPDFQLPDVEQDVVVFGILASKSDPKTHKSTGPRVKEKAEADPTRSKYMALTLVDLKWEVELFLFNSGFERYWKLTPGTLLAILNPTIMPPPPGRTDTGRFSLVINSGEDAILEIGMARDLGFCKSVKKDGVLCSSWVNSKRTEFCEFHMNLALSKKRLARQDVNAFDTGLGPKKSYNSHRLPKWDEHANDPGKKHRGNYDRSTQSSWFMRKPSAANMIDNEVLGGEFGRVASTIERSEALRRRLATEEKERDLMKKLGEAGKGAGKEYMLMSQRSAKTGSAIPSSLSSGMLVDESRPHHDAKSLGLISDKGSKIHLSPVKRKRVESALSNRSSVLSASTASTPTPKGVALGWGGDLKNKLARMKEGERLNGTRRATHDDENVCPRDMHRDGTQAPARKKTRFVTEKGIREAGRESLGDELSNCGTMHPRTQRSQQLGSRMMYLDPNIDDDGDDGELIILR
ncbi:hypothetical protein GGS21DRAFT_248575 [Xylaria nigripes]|nr:hypothetical protein GGS21DRAFT_248575 [Xylaria nigripes]